MGIFLKPLGLEILHGSARLSITSALHALAHAMPSRRRRGPARLCTPEVCTLVLIFCVLRDAISNPKHDVIDVDVILCHARTVIAIV